MNVDERNVTQSPLIATCIISDEQALQMRHAQVMLVETLGVEGCGVFPAALINIVQRFVGIGHVIVKRSLSHLEASYSYGMVMHVLLPWRVIKLKQISCMVTGNNVAVFLTSGFGHECMRISKNSKFGPETLLVANATSLVGTWHREDEDKARRPHTEPRGRALELGGVIAVTVDLEFDVGPGSLKSRPP